MCDESYFITDTAVGREVEKVFCQFVSYRRLKAQKHLVSLGLFSYALSFYEGFNRQLTEAVFSYSKP